MTKNVLVRDQKLETNTTEFNTINTISLSGNQVITDTKMASVENFRKKNASRTAHNKDDFLDKISRKSSVKRIVVMEKKVHLLSKNGDQQLVYYNKRQSDHSSDTHKQGGLRVTKSQNKSQAASKNGRASQTKSSFSNKNDKMSQL